MARPWSILDSNRALRPQLLFYKHRDAVTLIRRMNALQSLSSLSSFDSFLDFLPSFAAFFSFFSAFLRFRSAFSSGVSPSCFFRFFSLVPFISSVLGSTSMASLVPSGATGGADRTSDLAVVSETGCADGPLSGAVKSLYSACHLAGVASLGLPYFWNLSVHCRGSNQQVLTSSFPSDFIFFFSRATGPIPHLLGYRSRSMIHLFTFATTPWSQVESSTVDI